jgi:hypothetical protein
VPDPRQFDKCAAKPFDGKACRHIPRVQLLKIGTLALGDPLLGRTLVAACHCTQCTKKIPRFPRRRLAVGFSYVVKRSQEGLSIS